MVTYCHGHHPIIAVLILVVDLLSSAVRRIIPKIFLYSSLKVNFGRIYPTMKHTLSVFFLVLLFGSSYGQPIDEIRKRFHQAVLSQDSIVNYHHFIVQVKDTFPTTKAYRAAGEAMMAQTLWNPLGKLSQVNRYEKLILEAIEMDMNNLEIRFLRFAIEFHLPRILMMSKHLEEDRDFIVSNLWRCEEMNIDPEFERYITYFMNETGMLLPEQITVIKELLSRPLTN